MRNRTAAILGGVALSGLAACAGGPVAQGIYDPAEVQNRAVHQANRALDRALVRPASNAYGLGVPAPVRRAIGNFAANLNLPGQVANNLLQARPQPAVQNTFRFIINTTLGVGGLFDPATSIGVADAPTDFGETLHVWGVREGAYVELPLVGPSTSRDTAGKLVDLALNPLNFVLPSPERYVATASQVASRFGDRYQYSDFVDQVLYESADSYAQARLLYLQNRRFALGGESAEQDFIDPYEDPYAE